MPRGSGASSNHCPFSHQYCCDLLDRPVKPGDDG